MRDNTPEQSRKWSQRENETEIFNNSKRTMRSSVKHRQREDEKLDKIINMLEELTPQI